MSENPTEQCNHALAYNIDPRLAEWSHIQLAPVRVDDAQNDHQGPLPFILPYATDIYPYMSPFDAPKHGVTGVSWRPVLWHIVTKSLIKAVTR